MFIAIFDLPYGFYEFLRIITFIGVIGLIHLFNYQISQPAFLLLFLIIIGLLWNPILPIYLDRGSWFVFNLIAGIFFAFIAYNVSSLKN
jgi:FtsH-binding integral membrane protein